MQIGAQGKWMWHLCLKHERLQLEPPRKEVPLKSFLPHVRVSNSFTLHTSFAIAQALPSGAHPVAKLRVPGAGELSSEA